METTNNLIANILKKKPHSASEYKNENLVNINPGVFEMFPSRLWQLPLSPSPLKILLSWIQIYIITTLSLSLSLSSEIQVLLDADGLIYYEDLMEESSLQSSLNILEKDYDDAIRNKAELDERVFINEEDSLLGSGSVSAGSLNITGAKVNFDAECIYKHILLK